jgi:hypothetical protein
MLVPRAGAVWSTAARSTSHQRELVQMERLAVRRRARPARPRSGVGSGDGGALDHSIRPSRRARRRRPLRVATAGEGSVWWSFWAGGTLIRSALPPHGRGRGLGHLDPLGGVDDARQAGRTPRRSASSMIVDSSPTNATSTTIPFAGASFPWMTTRGASPHGVDSDDRSCSLAAHGSVLWTPQVVLDASRETISSPA